MGDGGAVVTDACFLLLGEKGGYGRWLQLLTPISKYLVTAGLRESASARASKAAFQSVVSSCSPPQRCCDAQLLGRASTSHGGGQRGAPGSALQVPVLPVSLCMTLGYVICKLSKRFFHPGLLRVHLNISPVFEKTHLFPFWFRCPNPPGWWPFG